MSIKLTGATSGSIEIDVPAAVSGGDISLTLPNGVGSANQFLKNGSTAGTLEFGGLGSLDRVKRTYGTEVSVASGDTEVEFTGIPANFSLIRIIFHDISFSGSDNLEVEIGHAASGGTYLTSGYTSYSGSIATSTNAGSGITDAFRIRLQSLSSHIDGYMELFPNKASSPSRLFEFNSAVTDNAASQRLGAGFSPDISSVTIDRIRLKPEGTNTFDDANGRVTLITEVIE